MINKILDQIKDKEMTIGHWIVGFAGILFVRFFLESLSSPTNSGIIPSDAYTLVHYGLFWTTLLLGVILIVGYFSKNYLLASKMALFGLPSIWLAPIFDLIISRGTGYTQSYIFDNGKKLIFDFFTFFGPNLTSGATYGMRLEIFIILIGIGWYLWRENKNILQTVSTVLCVYIFGFILISLPGIIHTFSGSSLDISSYFENIIFHSTLWHNTLHEGASSLSHSRFFEIGFDKLMSQILFVISFCFAILLSWKINSKKFFAVIKNSRPERIGSYLALLLCGVGYAYINNLGDKFILVDLLGVFCLIISWISLWMHAVHVNDIADTEIDKISNKERPLIKGDVSPENMREVGYLWLTFALLGSWSAGFYPFFMSLVYIATYYIYSSPPLRLRRFPGISSFLIGIAGLSTILAGFFFVSAHKEIGVFPPLLSIGIIIMITLAINVKDMKDIEGDRSNGIISLPILFGKHGPQVVGLCFALSFLLVPAFLSFYMLYIVALPASIIGYRLVTKKPYREEPIFILRFVFLTLVAIFYLTTYWLAGIYHI